MNYRGVRLDSIRHVTERPAERMANLFRKIFRRSADVIQDGVLEGPGIKGGDPVNVTGADSALALATVYRCVSLISESVASLPLLHEKRIGDRFTTDRGELTRFLSQTPNESASAFDFWKQAIQTRLLFGEAYIVPSYDMFGGLKRLTLARPGTGSPYCSPGLYWIEDEDNGLHGVYEEEEVIRLKGMTLDGVHCMSVIGYAARAASIAATADRNMLQTFANGGSAMGIIANESGIGGYGEMQTEALQQAANRLSRSLRQGDRLLALGGKWQYIPFTMTAADMQFLESRKFSVREICRFFGVPPTFVFDDTSNNYKSAEMANVAFLSNTLEPILRQTESEIERKLRGLVGTGRVRFNREELYATDLDGRMRYVEKRIQTGTMTPNEARSMFGMPPAEGGDTLFMSANLRPATEMAGDAETANKDDKEDDDDNEEI